MIDAHPPTPPAANAPEAPADLGATGNLDALSAYFSERARRVVATLAHLRRLQPEQRTMTEGTYRVFDCAETAQLFILRGVTALDGTAVVYESETFAAALRWTNERRARCTT